MFGMENDIKFIDFMQELCTSQNKTLFFSICSMTTFLEVNFIKYFFFQRY